MTEFSDLGQEGFDIIGFRKAVLERMGLSDIPVEEREKLEHEIGKRVEQRIVAAVVGILTPEEVNIFEQVMRENEDIDPIKVVIDLANQHDELSNVLDKAMQDLYQELVADADKVNEIYDRKKEGDRRKRKEE